MKTMLTLGAALVLMGAIDGGAARAAAAAADTAAPSEAAGELQEVIVTGTRRTDRTAAESSAPIDILSGSELASQPTGNMLDTLSNLVPSFIVGQNSISDASSLVRSSAKICARYCRATLRQASRC